MKVSAIITLKKDVLDPQGKVVENTLINMGISNLQSVRQGKHFEIEIKENDEKTAEMPRFGMRMVLNILRA